MHVFLLTAALSKRWASTNKPKVHILSKDMFSRILVNGYHIIYSFKRCFWWNTACIWEQKYYRVPPSYKHCIHSQQCDTQSKHHQFELYKYGTAQSKPASEIYYHGLQCVLYPEYKVHGQCFIPFDCYHIQKLWFLKSTSHK